MRVNLVYDRPTIQGEGPFAGRRCTFVRLWGCNLHCRWCDSAETWDINGRNGVRYLYRDNAQNMRAFEVVERVRTLDVDLVIITGGEPLIQREELIDLCRIFRAEGISVHVETNGTISPGAALATQVEHFVVSPKLPNAEAGAKAINIPVLRGFTRLGSRGASFKVVVSSTDELLEAVELFDEIDAEPRQRWVMPEGRTALEVMVKLEHLTEKALALGLNVSGRQHVMLWGDERGR